MEQGELLRKMAVTLDKLGIAYAVVGSTATTVYGDPRFTNDIDIVIDLHSAQIDAFCAEFPDADYYLSRAAVESAVRKQFQFNIIHPSSGFKVDCIVASSDPFDRSQLERAIRIPKEGGAYEACFASAEDVIIKKLEYFKLGQSEKHTRDICGILKQQGEKIDRQYIRGWALQKGLIEIWDAIVERLSVV